MANLKITRHFTRDDLRSSLEFGDSPQGAIVIRLFGSPQKEPDCQRLLDEVVVPFTINPKGTKKGGITKASSKPDGVGRAVQLDIADRSMP